MSFMSYLPQDLNERYAILQEAADMTFGHIVRRDFNEVAERSNLHEQLALVNENFTGVSYIGFDTCPESDDEGGSYESLDGVSLYDREGRILDLYNDNHTVVMLEKELGDRIVEYEMQEWLYEFLNNIGIEDLINKVGTSIYL